MEPERHREQVQGAMLELVGQEEHIRQLRVYAREYELTFGVDAQLPTDEELVALYRN